MKRFFLALQFLTIIPLKIKSVHDREVADSSIYFPVVGLLLGLILVALNSLCGALNFARLLTDIILVISLIAITGGMHLDGLSDTADAFLSAKNKNQMLRIMRDPHIGVMGAISIICILLLKISLLFFLNPPLITAALILMCVLSRWSLVFSLFLFTYARQEGKAKVFKEGINPGIFILATIIALLCASVFAGWKGLFILGIVTLSAYIIGSLIKKKLGGITGDTLGATNELIEVITLLSVYFLERA